MLALSLPQDADWITVARSVFWSRDVALDTWRAQVIAGHPSYLPDSVARMSTWHFMKFLGRTPFEQRWPLMRQHLPAEHPGRARLDVAWSLATTGTLNMPPQDSLADFPGRSREVYDAVLHRQGMSIYELAQRTRIHYRRVHAHVQALSKRGLLRSRVDANGPRPKRLLYVMRG